MEKVQLTPEQNSPNTMVATLERGKIPPQDIRIEEAVLGGMLIDKKGVDEVIDILQPEAFYRPAHQYIYEAIAELFKNTQPIDILTVSDQLRKQGKLELAGGEFYLIQLTQKVSSAAHIEFHARVILQKHIQRSLIKISNEIIEEAYDETNDVFDLLDNAESKLFNITDGNLKRTSESAKDLVMKARKKIEEISNRGEEFSGVPSGFNGIDKVTAGWQPTDLIIVAARPAMGKTAFTLSMARNISIDSKMPVAFFSLEMSSVQLITRLISSETGLDQEKLRKGNLEPHEWQQLTYKVQHLENAPLYIDDTPSLSIFDLRAKARRLVSQFGIKIIIIDYLQLMTVGGGKGAGNREQEISTISRNLKALAKELNIPIIALSQLSRNVENRQGHKRPQLADLRESGAIEQDADIVTFLYRPEYYKMETWDDKEQTPTENQAEFIIAKHRNGGLDNVRLKFTKGVFSNLNNDASPMQYQSKMNNDDSFSPPTILPSVAFDSPFSETNDSEVPF